MPRECLRNTDPEVAATVARYEKWLRSWSRSARTVTARRRLAANRLEEWGIEGFTPAAVQQWLADSDFSAWSRATYHANLNSLGAWLVDEGLLPSNPMAKVKTGKRPRSIPRPLTDPEIASVIEAAEGDVRDWIRIALLTGLRVHEIAKLRGADVAPTHIFVEGKGGVRALIPTHPDVLEVVERIGAQDFLWPANSSSGHVTPTYISAQVSRVFRSVGVEGSIHRCRHTYATRLLRAGVHLKAVQELMRHASLATTEGYLAVTDDEKRAAIELLSVPEGRR